MDEISETIDAKVAEFHAWKAGRSMASARVVNYCGDECTGGIDVHLDDTEDQIRGCLAEGFRVEWELKADRLYLCVSEGIEGPLDWEKVFREEHFSDIDAILRQARFEPPQRDA